jgi:L-threonylcarbamoyladenylate synthase
MATIYDIETQPDAAMDAAVAALAREEPIGIPTETVYGLAADATSAYAISAIYEKKGRPRFNPLICHVSDLAMAERYGEFDSLSRKLALAFWPGPLTLVVPLKPGSEIHPLATAGLSTVGLRVPAGFAGKLIARFGKPLAAPSANTSGRISPTTAMDVQDDLGQKLRVILDGGPTKVGVESTIVKSDEQGVHLLRPGGLSVEDIERVIVGKVLRDVSQTAAIEAPGMLASHYAPDAKVRLNATRVSLGEALINFGGQPVTDAGKAVARFDLSPAGNLREAAANLFSMLRAADRSGAFSIAVAPVPMTGLGEAINDRLMRAAAPRGK